MTLELRPYEAGDEGRVTARADFAAAYAENGCRLPAGPKVTMAAGDRVLAVAGIEPLGGRQWGAWAYCAALTPREWLAAGQLAADYLATCWRIFEPRLIQAVPEPTVAAAAARLLARVGFRPSDLRPDLYLMTGSP